jgi:hypothetical protein
VVGGFADDGAEDAVEVGEGLKADVVGDFTDACLGIVEELLVVRFG